MSAGLISQKSVQHDFRDDLESSIYVLLWMTLMFSEVSNNAIVPTFLSNVLDPRPYSNNGGHSKMDFLCGRTFLSNIEFPDRTELLTLVVELASLFSVRYEKEPSAAERSSSQYLLEQEDPTLRQMYTETQCAKYDKWIQKLEDHMATIELFNAALKDRTKWPSNDAAVLQKFDAKQPVHLVMKTGFYTNIYPEELAGGDGDVTQLGDAIMGTG